MKTSFKKNILLLITAAIWGFNFVAQHVAMDSMGPLFYQFVRFVIASIVMGIIVLIRHSKDGDHSYIKYGILCGVVLFSASACQQVGLVITAPGKAAFITALYVVFVPVLSIFTVKRPDGNIWISVVLAIIGLYLLTVKSEFGISTSDIYILASAVLYSIHIMLIDKFAPNVDIYKYNLIQFSTVAVLSIISCFIFKEEIVTSSIIDGLPLFLYSGVLSTGVAYTTQTLGQVDNNPTIASLIMSMESVFATLGGYLFLHNVLSRNEMIGCILIMIAIINAEVPSRPIRRKKWLKIFYLIWAKSY